MVLRNILWFCLLSLVIGTYPPIGDVVELGSVLLPATRRGRYLANIVRRQAIDGTGIKFNKDADRMNAESKKKVDVLSEELLPYIISEQERRTTLHKRVMTALQNGEKGVTIAEIRNKPPLIIKRGLLYRCPSNRSPIEPDGSGVLKCEGDIEPSPVLYDSCLSAEDKDLYVAGNKVFFCNRHKIEGPDLPRNGSTIVGCAPSERTSFNYTLRKCAIEGTEDVVVHYRYYPDKSYTFVREMDPDREVCDHWNPCQIGYIFSLPTIDQGLPANDLWPNFVENEDDYERDEIIDAVPDILSGHPRDFKDETIHTDLRDYVFSNRRVKREKGMVLHAIVCTSRYTRGDKFGQKHPHHYLKPNSLPSDDEYVYINPGELMPEPPGTHPSYKVHYEGEFSVAWINPDTKEKKHSEPFIQLLRSNVKFNISMDDIVVQRSTGQINNRVVVEFNAKYYRPKHIRLRSANWNVYNLNPRYWKITFDENTGVGTVILNLGVLVRKFFGSYFLVMDNSEGVEEKFIILKIIAPEKDETKVLKASELRQSYAEGAPVSANATYTCPNCNLTDIVRNGESVLSSSHVQPFKSDTVIFNIPSFEDQNAGVYRGRFQKDGAIYERILAVIDNSSPEVSIPEYKEVDAPKGETEFEIEVKYTCSEPCTVEKVFANGIGLDAEQNDNTIPGSGDDTSVGFFEATPSSIIIRIDQYSEEYNGVYQAVFRVGDKNITKNIVEVIGNPARRMDKHGSLRSDAISDSKPVNVVGDETDRATTVTEVTDEVPNIVTDKVTSETTTTDKVTHATEKATVIITNKDKITSEMLTTDVVTDNTIETSTVIVTDKVATEILTTEDVTDTTLETSTVTVTDKVTTEAATNGSVANITVSTVSSSI